jgi:hypothetical protein
VSATTHRGWLVAALVLAVAVLIGTVLAVAVWGDAMDAPGAATHGACSGAVTRQWQGRGCEPDLMDGYRGYGPGMMDGYRGSGPG